MQLDDEKSLIEVQLLIGRLLKAVKQNDYNAIEHIKKNISVLLDAYRVLHLFMRNFYVIQCREYVILK